MPRQDAGEANHCVVCGRPYTRWGLCLPCRKEWESQDGTRPQWLKALLAMHRKEQRTRVHDVGRPASLEELASRGGGDYQDGQAQANVVQGQDGLAQVYARAARHGG